MSQKRFPIIKQRTSKYPITITNFLGDTKIRLEIKATKEDWDSLYKLLADRSYSDFNEFQRDFSSSFLYPFYIRYYFDTNYKQFKSQFILEMQMFAGILYELFSYCFKRMKNNLPNCIIKLKEDERLEESIPTRNISHRASGYTAYCIQSIYKYFLDKFHLKPFFDFDEEEIKAQDLQSFYIKYIHVGKNHIKQNYDNVIGFWCYSFLRGQPFSLSEKDIEINKNVNNLYKILNDSFLYRKNSRRRLNKEKSEMHNILLNIFPFLPDIDNILLRLKWDNPTIDDSGFVHGLPTEEDIEEYRKKNKPPPEQNIF